MTLPPCPVCKSNRMVSAKRAEPGMFICGKCHGQFDDAPDEGGSHSNFNPAARIEREEWLRQQRLQKRKGE